MSNQKKKNKRFYLGVALCVLGLIILLEKLGVLHGNLGDMLISWEMILIIIGLVLMQKRKKSWGIVLVGVGGFFMLTNYVLETTDSRQYLWPILLIVFGVIFIYRELYLKKASVTVDDKGEEFDDFVVFGGKEIHVNSSEMKRGQATAIFGGIEYDLREVLLSDEGGVIDCVCLFGGVGIRIPPDWIVRNEMVTILGTFSDKRASTFATNDSQHAMKVLVVRGTTLFGGVEVKY